MTAETEETQILKHYQYICINSKLTLLKKLPEKVNDSRDRGNTNFKALSVYIYTTT